MTVEELIKALQLLDPGISVGVLEECEDGEFLSRVIRAETAYTEKENGLNINAVQTSDFATPICVLTTNASHSEDYGDCCDDCGYNCGIS